MGREIYFHRNSVLNSAFEHLDIGGEVIFSEEAEEFLHKLEIRNLTTSPRLSASKRRSISA